MTRYEVTHLSQTNFGPVFLHYGPSNYQPLTTITVSILFSATSIWLTFLLLKCRHLFRPKSHFHLIQPQVLPIMAAVLDQGIKNFTNILITPNSPSKLSYLLYPSLLITILILPAYRFVLKDYHAFLALGPGGTPKTFPGYLRVSYLRLFTISDPFRPPSLAETIFPTDGYLRQLPQRSGPRPTVAGIAPHRQLDQKCTAELHHVLRDGLDKLAAAFPSLIRKGSSCFEKQGLALFLSACTQSAPPNDTAHPGFSHLNPTCQDTGEICHLHALVSCPAHQNSNGHLVRCVL